jgi:hypothetical protein
MLAGWGFAFELRRIKCSYTNWYYSNQFQLKQFHNLAELPAVQTKSYWQWEQLHSSRKHQKLPTVIDEGVHPLIEVQAKRVLGSRAQLHEMDFRHWQVME